MTKEIKIIILFILMVIGLMVMAGSIFNGIVGSTLFFGSAYLIYKEEQGKSK